MHNGCFALLLWWLSSLISSPVVLLLDCCHFHQPVLSLCFRSQQVARFTPQSDSHIPQWKHFRNRGAPRVASTMRQEEIRKQIVAMLKKGIIKPSDASYYSQVILAIKPDGSLRFCIDYRNLNEATESACWPIPNIKQILYRLGAQRPNTFCVIDLTAGYHQAPITLVAQVFTAFITFMGMYQFTRLPFGPKMAPSYFQQMMASIVLLGLIYSICEVYLGDIIIYSDGHIQLCERLETLFQRLEDKNISLNAAKLRLSVKVVEYVGRQISKEGISMSTKKITGVSDFPMPRKARSHQLL